MSSSDVQARVGRALVDFAVKSQYPDEEAVIAADVESSALPVALELLSNARSSLEDEIRSKSREAAPDVDSWIEHAKTLQDDIRSSKRLANDIIRLAEADEEREELLEEQERYLSFMQSEVVFNNQLQHELLLIQEIYNCLERAEALLNDHQILPCLKGLEMAWKLIPKITGGPMTGVGRLLNARAFDLRATATDVLQSIWANLIVIDYHGGQITINQNLDGEVTTLEAAITCLTAIEVLEQRAKQFWDILDDMILKPRIDLSRRTLCYIDIKGNRIRVGAETADSTIKSLFLAMEDLIRYLVDHLPAEFIKPLSDAMMPDLSARLKEFWLDTAVPSSLDDVLEYQKALLQVHEFANKLQSLSWPGSTTFEEWLLDAHKMWINKRRETELDWTRNQLELGLGTPQSAKHYERQMVGKDEGKQIASSGNMANQDWDAAWNSEEEEPLPQEINRASLEEERRASEISPGIPAAPQDDDDDAAEAWGWDDEDAVDEPSSASAVEPPSPGNPAPVRIGPETREITLSETYYTSSIPRPLFNTVAGIFNDCARLTSPEFDNSPVTPAAPLLFTLPTLVLTMYRAVSPFHYARHDSGNMFAYNDSMWLRDKLAEFQSEWQKRNDLSPRAYGKVRLETEIKNLESFGKRAYANELNAQRTVITDLLGGAQNFFREDATFKTFEGELDAEIESVMKHIRTVAAAWKPILAYSAWASAIGSLVNTVASKIISDVFDLEDVSADGANSIAASISDIIKINDLFIPPPDPNAQSNGTDEEHTDPTPTTWQFADKWVKLQFLGEVLKEDLHGIKYYWFEGGLSLHFTAEEVVELIGLSFENNPASRQAKKQIKENPSPRVE